VRQGGLDTESQTDAILERGSLAARTT